MEPIKCLQCKALIDSDDAVEHTQWHEALNKRIREAAGTNFGRRGSTDNLR